MVKKIKLYTELSRINRPVGILLLALPCLFGVFLALKGNDNFSVGNAIKIIALFIFGSISMRSAGCVINDILDRNFDKKIARTKLRPLANDTLNLRQALVFLAFLLLISLFILLQFNSYTIASGLLALVLVVLYPLMKRITFYPQIFLGVTFNYGILMAGLAINQTVSVAGVTLFLACVIWTLIYDTIYAFQDIEDDATVGVKSSAIKFASRPQVTLAVLTLTMFALIFYVGFLQNFGEKFYFFAAVAFFYELFLILKCNYASPALCLEAFKANVVVGILILLAIISG